MLHLQVTRRTCVTRLPGSFADWQRGVWNGDTGKRPLEIR
jgi:hypothetical protein